MTEELGSNHEVYLSKLITRHFESMELIQLANKFLTVEEKDLMKAEKAAKKKRGAVPRRQSQDTRKPARQISKKVATLRTRYEGVSEGRLSGGVKLQRSGRRVLPQRPSPQKTELSSRAPSRQTKQVEFRSPPRKHLPVPRENVRSSPKGLRGAVKHAAASPERKGTTRNPLKLSAVPRPLQRLPPRPRLTTTTAKSSSAPSTLIGLRTASPKPALRPRRSVLGKKQASKAAKAKRTGTAKEEREDIEQRDGLKINPVALPELRFSGTNTRTKPIASLSNQGNEAIEQIGDKDDRLNALLDEDSDDWGDLLLKGNSGLVDVNGGSMNFFGDRKDPREEVSMSTSKMTFNAETQRWENNCDNDEKDYMQDFEDSSSWSLDSEDDESPRGTKTMALPETTSILAPPPCSIDLVLTEADRKSLILSEELTNAVRQVNREPLGEAAVELHAATSIPLAQIMQVALEWIVEDANPCGSS
mmetsp:Transcript_5377/g.9664  ORF Transcript_5377/g.9664 Transcript_5377/m.9664 type:complete len:474 (-) Transcript_5377:86-1507(-)